MKLGEREGHIIRFKIILCKIALKLFCSEGYCKVLGDETDFVPHAI